MSEDRPTSKVLDDFQDRKPSSPCSAEFLTPALLKDTNDGSSLPHTCLCVRQYLLIRSKRIHLPRAILRTADRLEKLAQDMVGGGRLSKQVGKVHLGRYRSPCEQLIPINV